MDFFETIPERFKEAWRRAMAREAKKNLTVPKELDITMREGEELSFETTFMDRAVSLSGTPNADRARKMVELEERQYQSTIDKRVSKEVQYNLIPCEYCDVVGEAKGNCEHCGARMPYMGPPKFKKRNPPKTDSIQYGRMIVIGTESDITPQPLRDLEPGYVLTKDGYYHAYPIGQSHDCGVKNCPANKGD